MPKYIVRVQLFQREEQHPDYDRLHADMESEGFLLQIEHRKNGEVYDLPHAMYVVRRRGGASDVLEEVHAIADGVWRKNCVFVVRAESYAWTGLRKASAANRMSHRMMRFLHWY